MLKARRNERMREPPKHPKNSKAQENFDKFSGGEKHKKKK